MFPPNSGRLLLEKQHWFNSKLVNKVTVNDGSPLKLDGKLAVESMLSLEQ